MKHYHLGKFFPLAKGLDTLPKGLDADDLMKSLCVAFILLLGGDEKLIDA